MQKIESSTLLTVAQKAMLARGRIATIADVWLHAPSDIAKRARVSVEDVHAAVDVLCRETAPRSARVGGEHVHAASRLTTGESALDAVLGGGIQVGSMTEIVGEAAAGKTQLALQLAAMCQLPVSQGGLDGGTAYITTGAASLPTTRLAQIARRHPKTAKMDPAALLDSVHHCRAPTVDALARALRDALPPLCARARIRLLVLDSIAALFQTGERPTSATLAERARALADISTALHALAARRALTVLVLSHVTDVFPAHAAHDDGDNDDAGHLRYRDQARWFSQDAAAAKEATLGLAWANQLNTRIMLSRTARRRVVRAESDNENENDDGDDDASAVTVKRRKGADGTPIPIPIPIPARRVPPTEPEDPGSGGAQGTLIRRFSVVFSPSAAPASTDFIVAAAGVRAFDPPPSPPPRPVPPPPPAPLPTFVPGLSQLVRSGSLSLQNTPAAPVHASPRLPRVPSVDDLSAFDEDEWMAIAEQSDMWDAPEPEVEQLDEFIPSSQGHEVELCSTSFPLALSIDHS